MLKRENLILKIIQESPPIGIQEILQKVNLALLKKVTKITINRDLNKLIKNKLIIRTGNGSLVKYNLSKTSYLFKKINIKEYFLKNEDQRKIKKFNFKVFDLLQKVDIFNQNELKNLLNLNNQYQNNISKLPPDIIKKEFERLLIELSWKSSKIEGNTYDILETEFLIKEHQESAGHTKLEAKMILNHKDTFELIKNKKIKTLSLKKIKEVHNMLIKDMNISTTLRNKAVGITGTKYRPLKDQKLINKALNKLCLLVNSKNDIFSKSLLLNLLIAYIQPFNDGNKRTSRMMGNAILLANNYCPLSFRSINDLEYKKAMVLFYETNNISYFKELFTEQFTFATYNYFI